MRKLQFVTSQGNFVLKSNSTFQTKYPFSTCSKCNKIHIFSKPLYACNLAPFYCSTLQIFILIALHYSEISLINRCASIVISFAFTDSICSLYHAFLFAIRWLEVLARASRRDKNFINWFHIKAPN